MNPQIVGRTTYPLHHGASVGFTCSRKQKWKKERKKITLKNQGEM